MLSWNHPRPSTLPSTGWRGHFLGITAPCYACRVCLDYQKLKSQASYVVFPRPRAIYTPKVVLVPVEPSSLPTRYGSTLFITSLADLKRFRANNAILGVFDNPVCKIIPRMWTIPLAASRDGIVGEDEWRAQPSRAEILRLCSLLSRARLARLSQVEPADSSGLWSYITRLGRVHDTTLPCQSLDGTRCCW